MSVTAIGVGGSRGTITSGIVASLVGGLAALALGACASGSSGAPRDVVPAVRSWDLEADYETAWEAAVASARDLGFEMESAEPASNRLITEWRSFSSEVGSSRCGDRYWGMVEMRLQEIESRVRMWITPTFREGPRPEAADAQRCPTNGQLERSLSRLVINRVTPG